ncbi:transmembrane protein 115-like [Pollicipes pollicipes]|uniref:transmembrane protein 115-like n=1 Tax=Pollicipes pollicipes TaxID=41117 RepID=UPI001884F87C|nr:transmembrane protein 115-like [Pollicipes pollicipes]
MSVSSIKRNLPYVMQQATAAVANTGLFVKFVIAVTLVGYCLSFSDTLIDVLSVTPGYLLPPRFWLWTAFTHCFLEVHLWEVCIDIVTIVLCGKLLEPLWGGNEMLLFFLVVNVLVAVLSGFFYLFLYMCTFNTDLLFHVHIHGLAGYIAGCSVAVKQIMPDHVVIRAPIKITNRNVPLILVLFSILLYIIGAVEGSYATMFTLGFVISWTYLRFYQPHSNGTKGDMAEGFAFAKFFPNVLQPLISVVCNAIHSCLVKVRVCRRPVKKYDVGAPSSITISLPGVEPQDAERRRQIALKALSERLQRVDSPTSWPSMEDDPKSPPATHSPLPPAVAASASPPAAAPEPAAPLAEPAEPASQPASQPAQPDPTVRVV